MRENTWPFTFLAWYMYFTKYYIRLKIKPNSVRIRYI
jgi:hypothetical protein